jgi:hypothetical protein
MRSGICTPQAFNGASDWLISFLFDPGDKHLHAVFC